jgi:16S rRNA (cytosine967-C5)-methyltransferase
VTLKPGARVLDACAAPGGKTAHLLELADLDLLALDADPVRLARVQDTLNRLQLQGHAQGR